MELLGLIALFVSGIYLLILSHKMYKKDWKMPTCFFAFLGVLALFGTQEWIQGFYKTGILNLLIEYGDRLNKFQDTVGRVEENVKQHQNALAHHQQELFVQQCALSNALSKIAVQQNRLVIQQDCVEKHQSSLATQHEQLRSMQTVLSDNQKDISEQQEKIKSVEFLVQNLFSRTRYESYATTDTNRFVHLNRANNTVCWLFFKLNSPPIPNSVQGSFVDGNGRGNAPLLPGFTILGNVVGVVFATPWENVKNAKFHITFVEDPKGVELYKTMEVKDEQLLLDGKVFPIK